MDRARIYESACIFAAFLLGLMLRLVPMRNALYGGDVLFYGYDPYYHMRRIVYMFDHFPGDLWSDSYINYPYGHIISWPPLFDQVIAGIALIMNVQTRESLEMVGAIVPPILGSITILALYFLAKEIFDKRIALISSFLLAIDPVHIYKTQFGFTDHHVLEVLLVVSIILFLVLAISRDYRNYLFSLLAGITLAALAYTWIGTPTYLVALLLFLVLQLSIDIRRGVLSKDIAYLLITSIGCALILLLPFWNRPWLSPSVYSMTAILVVIAVIYALDYIILIRKLPWTVFPITVFVAAFILNYLVRFLPVIDVPLRSGAEFLFSAEQIGKISEAEPLFVSFEMISWFGLYFTLAIVGVAALTFVMLQNHKRSELLFLVWTLFILTLTVFQVRFLYLFSANMAVLASFLFSQMKGQISGSGLLKEGYLNKLVAAALLLVFFLPSLTSVPSIVYDKPEIADGWYESLQWLKDNTPVTSGFEEPVLVPEYSIFSWWDYGNWILYQSERPVVANNFQVGVEDSARFFLSNNEEDAVEILKSRGSRYVITDIEMIYGKLGAIATWIGEDVNSYQMVQEYGGYLSIRPLKKLMETTLSGLHLFDCSGMEHLRLIYESNGTLLSDLNTSRIKIYEHVSGAKICGTAPRDQPVGVLLNMTSNQGRHFTYFNYDAPEDGRYEIVVPYSTEARYATHATDPYQLIVGDDIRHIEISDEDVLKGRVIEVNF